MSFVDELKRRKVIRVAVAYTVTAWLVAQIIDVINEPFNLPGWFDTFALTLLGIGLPIALVLAWAFDVTPDGVQRTDGDTPSPGTQSGGVRRSRNDYLIVTVVVIAIGWLLYRTEFDTHPDTLDTAQQSDGVLVNSVAVLPFENMSPDPDNAYFAAGIHEETLNQLAKIEALAVIARTSVLGYAGTTKTVPEIGRELNVQSVLEGSVRYDGNRVRITAQLNDAKTGVHLWSDTYDRDLIDIFAIQTDIARQITTALKAEFSISEQASIGAQLTENPAAYRAYVKARSLLVGFANTRAIHTGFDEAIALDPEFAEALAAKAWLHGFEISAPFAGSVITRETQRVHADAAYAYARRALALDPDLANAYLALSLVATYQRRWDESFEAIQTAQALNPNSELILVPLAGELMHRGRIDESIPLWERAIALSPQDWLIPALFSNVLIWHGRLEYAIEQARHAIALAPAIAQGHLWLAYAAAFAGHNEIALVAAQDTEMRPMSVADRAFLMHVYAQLERTEDVQRLLHDQIAADESTPLNSQDWMVTYMATGDYDRSIDAIVEGVDQNFPNGMSHFLHFHHGIRFFNPVRDDPRFVAAVAQTGIPIP